MGQQLNHPYAYPSPVAPVEAALEKPPCAPTWYRKIHPTRDSRDGKELYLSQPVRALPAHVPDICLWIKSGCLEPSLFSPEVRPTGSLSPQLTQKFAGGALWQNSSPLSTVSFNRGHLFSSPGETAGHFSQGWETLILFIINSFLWYATGLLGFL